MSTHLPGFQSFFRFFASFCIGQISHHQLKGYPSIAHLQEVEIDLATADLQIRALLLMEIEMIGGIDIILIDLHITALLYEEIR